MMDFEPWWLISIPVLFALGWIAARVDIRQMLSETRSLPNSYFKGLNFLLNEEPDRAIDAFIEVARLDPETTELHFALGSLFRRRGEMERAIRVHQSLLARADLPDVDREKAQFELGEDFLKAGMLDRAEAAFQQVLETRYAGDANRALVRIYESSHEWPQAIAAVKRLQALTDEPVPQLVHYQCEQAVAAMMTTPPDLEAASDALDAADKAFSRLKDNLDNNHAVLARVAMLRAQLAKLQGDQQAECTYLTSVLSIAPEYGSLVAQGILDSYTALGEPDTGLALLQRHYEQVPALDTFNVIFRELRRQQGYDEAWRFAREALRKSPTLLGLDRMLEAELASDDSSASVAVASGADLGLLRSIIKRHTVRLDRYACRHCGFEARHFYWQCPGCNSWETYQPRRLEEL